MANVKRLGLALVVPGLWCACTEPTSSPRTDGGTRSSSSAGSGWTSSSTASTAATREPSSASSGAASRPGSRGASSAPASRPGGYQEGSAPATDRASACANPRELVAGTLSGDTTGRGDGLSGCLAGTGAMGAGAEEEVWGLTLTETTSLEVAASGRDLSLYLLRGDTCASAALWPSSCTDADEPDLWHESLAQSGLPAGRYWLVVDGVAANGQRSVGPYQLEVQLSPGRLCAPDPWEQREGAPDNDTAARATGPLAADLTEPVPLSLCPQDTDWLWFRNPGIQGDAVVTLVGAAGLSVSAHLPVLDAAGAISGAAPAAQVTVTTEGADVVVTYPTAARGAQFMVQLAHPAMSIPRAGRDYAVRYSTPAATNRTCATAQPLTLPAPGAPALSLDSATVAGGDETNESTPDCLTVESTRPGRDEVVYRFTAPAAAVQVAARTRGFDSVLYLRQGDCCGPEVACNDDVSEDTGSAILTTLAPGATYFLFVDSWFYPGAFNLQLKTCAPDVACTLDGQGGASSGGRSGSSASSAGRSAGGPAGSGCGVVFRGSSASGPPASASSG